MKKITIFVITILCLTLLLSGCKANASSDTYPNLPQESPWLDYGTGQEVENDIDQYDGYNQTPDGDINIPSDNVPNDDIPSDNIPDDTAVPETLPPAQMASTEYQVQSLVTLNIRDNPATTGKVVGVLSSSQTLPFIATQNSWHKVVYKDNIAYVSANSSYSRLKPLVDDGKVIENVIAVGLSVLGTPYEFGSTRIIDYNFKPIKAFTGTTFDCSAFVQYSFYKGANINLYGDSRTMSKQGTTVKYKDIKRGDVIFMTSTARQYNTGIERIGHVGIYLGDNKLLHTYGTGGVRITEFNSFWRGRFISAKSMI